MRCPSFHAFRARAAPRFQDQHDYDDVEWTLGLAPRMTQDQVQMAAILLHSAQCVYESCRSTQVCLNSNAATTRMLSNFRLERQLYYKVLQLHILFR